MPPPVKSLALFSATNLTGTVVTNSVLVPADFAAPYVTIIATAPISPLNVFDIVIAIEVQQPDGSWAMHDCTTNYRDLVNGPLTPVSITSKARIEGARGNRVRGVLSCGQCILAASVVVDA